MYKTCNFQPQPLIYPISFVWSCKQIMNAIYAIFCGKCVFEHLKNVCLLYLVQSKDSKMHQQEVLFINSNVFEQYFVCSYTQSICAIFIKWFKQHPYMIQIQNTKFWTFTIICFCFILVHYTHSDQLLKHDFLIQGTSKFFQVAKELLLSKILSCEF